MLNYLCLTEINLIDGNGNVWPPITEGTDLSLLQAYTIYVTGHLFIEYFIVVEENATRLIPAIHYNCTDSPQLCY